MALSHGAMGWSEVCDCGISRSYSLAFLYYQELSRIIILVIRNAKSLSMYI